MGKIGLLPEGKYANCANGYNIHYLDEGEGEVVVFLHGSGPGASGYSNFKGNYPASCSLDAAFTTKLDENTRWVTVSDEIPLEADAVQVVNELQSRGPFSHVRLNIFPDGGVARLRVFGTRGG